MSVMGFVVSLVCVRELWVLGRKGLIREGIMNGDGLRRLLRSSLRLAVKELNCVSIKLGG